MTTTHPSGIAIPTPPPPHVELFTPEDLTRLAAIMDLGNPATVDVIIQMAQFGMAHRVIALLVATQAELRWLRIHASTLNQVRTAQAEWIGHAYEAIEHLTTDVLAIHYEAQGKDHTVCAVCEVFDQSTGGVKAAPFPCITRQTIEQWAKPAPLQVDPSQDGK